MKRSRVILCILGMFCSFVLGHVASWFMFRQEILIDYDSGYLRQIIRVGMATLRDEPVWTCPFVAFPLPNYRYALTGNKDWSTVDVSYGFDLKRAGCDYYAGRKVHILLESMVPYLCDMAPADASAVKEKTLRALHDEGIDGLTEFVREWQAQRDEEWPHRVQE